MINYNLRKYIKLKIILPLGLISLLTSCFYSGKYIAAYTVQEKSIDKNTKVITIDFINELAVKNSLSKDPKYNGLDTLGFYGRPYHYFKFWFEQKDTNTILKLDYWGMYGSRKNKPYNDLFIELNDFMKENFIILKKNIVEKNNLRVKK